MALSFAGNPQLTSRAGLVPSVEAGLLLLQDEILRGQRPLFTGYSNLKMLAFLIMPVFCAVSMICILIGFVADVRDA